MSIVQRTSAERWMHHSRNSFQQFNHDLDKWPFFQILIFAENWLPPAEYTRSHIGFIFLLYSNYQRFIIFKALDYNYFFINNCFFFFIYVLINLTFFCLFILRIPFYIIIILKLHMPLKFYLHVLYKNRFSTILSVTSCMLCRWKLILISYIQWFKFALEYFSWSPGHFSGMHNVLVSKRLKHFEHKHMIFLC